MLANIYLHYVLDLWVAKVWRPKRARCEMYIVRYADDFVLGFKSRADAERFLRDLRERLGKFGMRLHPRKTRLIEFGRFAATNRKQKGQGKPETFDFLGFTHYCRRTRKGKFGLGRKPVGKRMKRKLADLRRKLKRSMHADPIETGAWLGQVLNGWLNYYAVPTSYRSLSRFRYALKQNWMWVLSRRSQKARPDWEKLDVLCKHLWPKVTIRHEWPDRRFAVNHSR